MKKSLTFLFIVLLVTCSNAQKKDITASSAGITVTDEVRLNQLGLDNKVHIPFDELHAMQILEAEKAAEYYRKADSTKWAIVRDIVSVMVQKGKLDPKRISQNGDSTKVTPEGIHFKLKPKKNGR